MLISSQRCWGGCWTEGPLLAASHSLSLCVVLQKTLARAVQPWPGGDEQGHAGDTGQRRGAQGSAGNGVQPSWGCLPREVSSSRGTVSPASASPRAGWGFTKSIQSQCLATISGGQAGVLPSSQKGGYRPGCPRRHPAPCPRSILAARFKARLGRRKLSQEEKGAVSFENVGCFSHLIW